MFENIPKHWKKKKIKELCDFQNGYAFNSNDYVNDGFPIIRMSNISVNGELNLNTNNTKFFPKENIDKVKQYFLKENDVIIAMTDMSKEMGIIGKTAIIDKSDIYLLNQRVGKFIIKDNKVLNYKYLHAYTNSPLFINYARQQCSGGVQLNLSTKAIMEHQLLLPTLEEQQEIVDVLDAASEIIRLRTACIESAQSLIPALFQEMFGDINNNIHSLPISEIKSCVEINPTKIIMNDNDDVTFLGMKDVTENGQMDLSTIKKYEEVKKGFTSFKNDDVLLAKITPCFENGKAAIAKNLVNNTGFGSTEFYVLRPEQNKILPEYLYSIVKSSRFLEIGKSNMKGAAGQKRLIKDFVSNYKFLLPDMPQQELFATKAQEIEAYIKIQQAELENAKTMFQSLLHYAFMGKLTENITFEVKNE